MLDVASRVFGTYFPDDAVIGEDRRELSVFLKPLDASLPVPSPGEVAALPDPAATAGGMDRLARTVLGCDTSDARELGRRLLAHPVTHDLLATGWTSRSPPRRCWARSRRVRPGVWRWSRTR
ncbi:hypothetical protein O1L55_04760 [Streptomyces albulus]|nr:hypothetical protein [Streptomyces noursei]